MRGPFETVSAASVLLPSPPARLGLRVTPAPLGSVHSSLSRNATNRTARLLQPRRLDPLGLHCEILHCISIGVQAYGPHRIRQGPEMYRRISPVLLVSRPCQQSLSSSLGRASRRGLILGGATLAPPMDFIQILLGRRRKRLQVSVAQIEPQRHTLSTAAGSMKSRTRASSQWKRKKKRTRNETVQVCGTISSRLGCPESRPVLPIWANWYWQEPLCPRSEGNLENILAVIYIGHGRWRDWVEDTKLPNTDGQYPATRQTDI